jgi:hypothetical protein
MRSKHILVFIIAYLILSACNKQDESLKSYKVEGLAQKGPFIIGSDVTVIELNNNLIPTGRTYFSTIIDDRGSFSLPHVELASKYIQIKVEGQYFDEINNGIRYSEITLFTVTDVSKNNQINVNLLTHIETDRIQYLVEQGISFDEAKEQAQKEILMFFGFENNVIEVSENLDISKSGYGNSVLLAISSILMGHLNNAGLLEILTNLRTDIKEDGAIDSDATKQTLLINAESLTPTEIVTNLKNRYSEIGFQYDIPQIDSLIDHFINNSGYSSDIETLFPARTAEGINLLRLSQSDTVRVDSAYCIAVVPPAMDNDFNVQIELQKLSSTGYINTNEALWSGFENGIYQLNIDENNQSSISIPVSFIDAGNFSIKSIVMGINILNTNFENSFIWF